MWCGIAQSSTGLVLGVYISRSTNITQCTIIPFLKWFSKQFIISLLSLPCFPQRILCFPAKRPCLFCFLTTTSKHRNIDGNPHPQDFSVNANQTQILSQMCGRAKPSKIDILHIIWSLTETPRQFLDTEKSESALARNHLACFLGVLLYLSQVVGFPLVSR